MNEIYLKNLVDDTWVLFKYNDRADIASDLAARSITINSKTTLPNKNVHIGNNCSILESVIKKGVIISDNVTIGLRNEINENVLLSDGVTLENDIIIHKNSSIGSSVILRSNIVIGEFTKVSAGVDLSDKYYIKTDKTPITYVGNGKFAFGCESKHIDNWLNEAEATGSKYGYTRAELLEHIRYINHAKAFYDAL